MTVPEKVKMIAEYYGYNAQSWQCIEEMAELTQAINKLRRAQGSGQPTSKNVIECRNDLLEELSDVQIMIWQMRYLLGFDLDSVINYKLERQLKLMKERK